MRIFKFVSITFLLFVAAHASAANFNVVTSDYPPLQVQLKNQVSGITTAIVNQMLADTEHKGVIKIYPWARAYQIAQKQSNILIYSIARTPEREKLFKWIGTVAPYQIYFWKLKSRADIKIKSIEDAKKYMNGGAYNDVKAMFLLKKGFIVNKNIEMVGSEDFNINKLYAKRIDLMLFDQDTFADKVKSLGLDPNKFEKLIKVEEISNDLYLAASLDVKDSIIAQFQKSLLKIKQRPH